MILGSSSSLLLILTACTILPTLAASPVNGHCIHPALPHFLKPLPLPPLVTNPFLTGGSLTLPQPKIHGLSSTFADSQSLTTLVLATTRSITSYAFNQQNHLVWKSSIKVIYYCPKYYYLTGGNYLQLDNYNQLLLLSKVHVCEVCT